MCCLPFLFPSFCIHNIISLYVLCKWKCSPPLIFLPTIFVKWSVWCPSFPQRFLPLCLELAIQWWHCSTSHRCQHFPKPHRFNFYNSVSQAQSPPQGYRAMGWMQAQVYLSHDCNKMPPLHLWGWCLHSQPPYQFMSSHGTSSNLMLAKTLPKSVFSWLGFGFCNFDKSVFPIVHIAHHCQRIGIISCHASFPNFYVFINTLHYENILIACYLLLYIPLSSCLLHPHSLLQCPTSACKA